MNKIVPLLVDDEDNGRVVLSRLLKNLLGTRIEMYEADSVESALQILEKTPSINTLFMDINMPTGDGFSLLDQLESQKYDIVFVTAYSEHSLKAFNYDAVHYLLKPVTESKLEGVIDRLERKRSVGLDQEKQANRKKFTNKISIQQNGVIELMDIRDLIFLEAGGTHTIFHFVNDVKKKSFRPLGHYSEVLDPSIFVRIHNSYLLNINHLKKVENIDFEVITTSGKKLPIAVRKKKHLNEILKQTTYK